jgi:hypothetical protein
MMLFLASPHPSPSASVKAVAAVATSATATLAKAKAAIVLNHPEATAQALAILRKASNFQWYVLPLLMIVLYVYFTEIKKKEFNVIASGLCLYGIHWLYEIGNGLIQHFWGHALWTVPTGTSYLILIGVSIELSLMFALAGIVSAKMLPEDPGEKILGINSRLVIGVLNAVLASLIELVLVMTPGFVWVYPWWNALTVGVFVYLPFFVISAFCHDWPRLAQKIVIGVLFGIDGLAMILFVGILRWI